MAKGMKPTCKKCQYCRQGGGSSLNAEPSDGENITANTQVLAT